MQPDLFIARWQNQVGGQERANYALFLSQLSEVIGVAPPDPAGDVETNDYVFERVVHETQRDGTVSHRRIDLYKRDCFVLEAKQSRQKGERKELPGLDLPAPEIGPRGRRGAERAWDVLMLNARKQAEAYVRHLPEGHAAPPFVIVCDVGHCFEIYANFRRDGKAYDQFPDRNGFRIYLEDLRDPAKRDTLAKIWTDPHALDPARKSAQVTRAIAERLAAVSKAMEARKFDAQLVAGFLMRCLFTMFADSMGLLGKERSFSAMLARCEADPTTFTFELGQLWEAMDKGAYAHALRHEVPQFNGAFFKERAVLPLGREEIGELRAAASHDWRAVEPAIFGTLLEQALDPRERRALGAHYTPRPYVERLVEATVMEPLRADWVRALSLADHAKGEGRPKDAVAAVQGFHDRLVATRVLDPACGTGNFLYVAMELMKRLEGEALEALANLGGQEALRGMESHVVNPRQFLGIEKNPRAAGIAELVLWIGHLQWHFRTGRTELGRPILHAYGNIECRDAVLLSDEREVRGPDGRLLFRPGPDGQDVPIMEHRNPRRPAWPEAEFIVGNPPFIGGKDIRARLGDAYAEALWTANGLNESADFVMYWWHRAAELLAAKGTKLLRFGFVTTNSIAQVFQRRVMERHLNGKVPVSIIMAIPDHPWTKATPDAAAVRIAMTVTEKGTRDGVLYEVTHESALDTDQPRVAFATRAGRINSDLTVGVDVAGTKALRASEGLCSRGVALHGAGFIVTRQEAVYLGLGRRPGLEAHIRPYRNGRDLMGHARGVMVIDLFGLTANDVRERFPEVYQHVLMTVKPERDQNNEEYRRTNWWLFGRKNTDLRSFFIGLTRYIATVETAKHRVFQFLDIEILPDNMLVVIGSDDAFHLGVLSSRVHVLWTGTQGGTLEDRPRYTKSRCFDPFPFPAATEPQRARIAAEAEALDALRKRVLADHPDLTLTGLYNVLERLRAGVAPADLTPDEHDVFARGLVGILREHHDALDALVAEAYGWPAALSAEDVLARLVALNAERAAEEARGVVRWLRPDYQAARFATPAERATQIEADLGPAAAVPARKPAFPSTEVEQFLKVYVLLAQAKAPLAPTDVALAFKQGRRVEPKISAVLAAMVRSGEISATGNRYTARAG